MPDVYISAISLLITLLSLVKIRSSHTFRQILTLYTISNLPLTILLEDYSYILSFAITVVIFSLIAKFIKDSYGTDTYVGLEGLVLSSPRLSFFLRLNLLMIANFPPFLSFGIVFEYLLRSGISLLSLYIITLLIFNFTIFTKLTNRLLFGKPNENVVYIDLPLRDTVLMGFLSLVNLVLGIYYLLNL